MKITVAVVMDIIYCKLWHHASWMIFWNHLFLENLLKGGP